MASQLVFEFYITLAQILLAIIKRMGEVWTAGMFHLIEALEQPVATFQSRQ